VLGCLGLGVFYIIGGLFLMTTKNQFTNSSNVLPGILLCLGGFATMVIGPFVARLYAELLILLFRVYDVLQEIRDQLDQR
jgi:hypothetical protein